MLRLVLSTALASAASAAPALAVPDCERRPLPRTVLSGQGVLESITSDSRGRLFYSDTSKNALMRLDDPGAAPRALSAGIAKLGGLAFDADGTIVTGTGNGFVEGAIGNVQGQAALLKVDPETGARRPFASGLSMANGLARAPDGSFYASDDAGTSIDRISATGVVQRNWATVLSGNGLVVDLAGEHLLAAQTFKPPTVARVPLARPAAVETYASGAATDVISGLDGMTRDGADRLFVTANGGGEVWRIDPDRSVCRLADGLPTASAASFGGGGAFPATSLYVTTFSGLLVELPDATDAPPEPADLAALPDPA